MYLKRGNGHPTVVSYLKLKTFNQPQLQAKNKPAIRSFQQQLKTNAIWQSFMGYHSAIPSTDNITKLVTRLPNYLYNKFYKEFKDKNKVDLLKFFPQLDESLLEAHNPIALIINAEEKMKKELEKSSSKQKDSDGMHSL